MTVRLATWAGPVGLLLLTTASRAATQAGQLIEFDAPGSTKVSSTLCAPRCGTVPSAINDLGEVTGYYADPQVRYHGFLRYPNGLITTFDPPTAGTATDLGPLPQGINDLGQIVGIFQTADLDTHGFVRNADGSFKIFNVPFADSGPFLGTLPFAINLRGDTAGAYINTGNVYHGFLIQGGIPISFDPPGSSFTDVCLDNCINDSDQVAGTFLAADDVFHGFLREADGHIVVFDVPGAGSGPGTGQGTFPDSLDDLGVITGSITGSDNINHGFIRFPDGHTVIINVPAAGESSADAFTQVNAANLLESVTGSTFNRSGAHGFVRALSGQVARLDVPGAGTAPGEGTFPEAINLEGSVAGDWIDANTVNHGFVCYPAVP